MNEQRKANADVFYQVGLRKKKQGEIDGAIVEFKRAASYGHEQAQRELEEIVRVLRKPEISGDAQNVASKLPEIPQVDQSVIGKKFHEVTSNLASASQEAKNDIFSSVMELQENSSYPPLKNYLIVNLKYFVEKEDEYRKLLLEGIDVFSGKDSKIKKIHDILDNKENKATIDTFFMENLAFIKDVHSNDEALTSHIKRFFNDPSFRRTFLELWNMAFNIMNKKLKNRMENTLKEFPQYEPQNFDEYMIKKIGYIARDWLNSNRNSPRLKQGFKLHITASPESALRVFLAVEPILETCHLYKFAGSLNYLEYINQHFLNQRGKFITIYPESEEDAQRLAVELNNALIKLPPEDFIPIPSDHPLGDSGGLYVRYGKFSGGNYLDVLDQNGDAVKNTQNVWSFVVEDDREGPWRPSFVTWDPFESLNFAKRK